MLQVLLGAFNIEANDTRFDKVAITHSVNAHQSILDELIMSVGVNICVRN